MGPNPDKASKLRTDYFMFNKRPGSECFLFFMRTLRDLKLTTYKEAALTGMKLHIKYVSFDTFKVREKNDIKS